MSLCLFGLCLMKMHKYFTHACKCSVFTHPSFVVAHELGTSTEMLSISLNLTNKPISRDFTTHKHAHSFWCAKVITNQVWNVPLLSQHDCNFETFHLLYFRKTLLISVATTWMEKSHSQYYNRIGWLVAVVLLFFNQGVKVLRRFIDKNELPYFRIIENVYATWHDVNHR